MVWPWCTLVYSESSSNNLKSPIPCWSSSHSTYSTCTWQRKVYFESVTPSFLPWHLSISPLRRFSSVRVIDFTPSTPWKLRFVHWMFKHYISSVFSYKECPTKRKFPQWASSFSLLPFCTNENPKKRRWWIQIYGISSSWVRLGLRTCRSIVSQLENEQDISFLLAILAHLKKCWNIGRNCGAKFHPRATLKRERFSLNWKTAEFSSVVLVHTSLINANSANHPVVSKWISQFTALQAMQQSCNEFSSKKDNTNYYYKIDSNITNFREPICLRFSSEVDTE